MRPIWWYNDEHQTQLDWLVSRKTIKRAQELGQHFHFDYRKEKEVFFVFVFFLVYKERRDSQKIVCALCLSPPLDSSTTSTNNNNIRPNLEFQVSNDAIRATRRQAHTSRSLLRQPSVSPFIFSIGHPFGRKVALPTGAVIVLCALKSASEYLFLQPVYQEFTSDCILLACFCGIYATV